VELALLPQTANHAEPPPVCHSHPEFDGSIRLDRLPSDVYALISLIVIIALSMLVVRVGTVALTMTGLSWETASMQALSAYSGAEFTTEEAEETVAYPARRRVIKNLMRLGNVGLVTSVTSLVLSFTEPTARLERLVSWPAPRSP
jgi:hypothetical protein